MAKGIYNINDIDDYMDKITGEQKKVLIKHCNRYLIGKIFAQIGVMKI